MRPDSEYWPDVEATADHRSAQVIQVESLGKGGIAVVIVTCILTMALSLAALFMGYLCLDRITQSEKRQSDKVHAAETRAMDYAYLAKQEARIAQDQVRELKERR